MERFIDLLQDAIRPAKKRKPTKPTRASIQRRLDSKKKRGEQSVAEAENGKGDSLHPGFRESSGDLQSSVATSSGMDHAMAGANRDIVTDMIASAVE